MKLTHGAILDINDLIKIASRGVKVGDVIGLGLNGSHGDEVPVQELLEASGDAALLMDGGEIAVEVPAGRSGGTNGVAARPELSSCGSSGIAESGSGRPGWDGGTMASIIGFAGSSSWDSGASAALHSVDSSAGSWTKVTVSLA